MTTNPYESPKRSRECVAPGPDPPSLAWWEARRLEYNSVLLLALLLAFACNVAVHQLLVPRVMARAEVDLSAFAVFLQAAGHVFALGAANICFFVGPFSEYILRPRNVARYRRITYRLGLLLSILLPFVPPVYFAALVLFFPELVPAALEK